MTNKTWDEMTPEEKGALLLAHHEGKVIECWFPMDKKWNYISSPSWIPRDAYRVRPEPRVIWVNCYENAFPSVHPTRKAADAFAGLYRIRCTRFVEQEE